MNVIEIIVEKLRALEADGLCTDNCGCGIDHLAPCCDWFGGCVPAKEKIATEAGEYHDVGDVIYCEMDLPNTGNQPTVMRAEP